MLSALVIDDDEIVRLFMQRLLARKFGFEVFLASDGIEGLSIIGQKKIDLIFTDINMPLMNGFEVVQAIKADSKLSSIPVVILSSHNERYMISKFLQFDIIDYILKPLDLEETTERLRKVLNKYRSEIRANKRASSFSEKDDEKKTILIADKDLNFRNFFSQLYESSYQIIEAANGGECLKKYLTDFPNIVLLSEGLDVVNELLLAKKIRNLDTPSKPEIFLLYDLEPNNPSIKIFFDGIIKKSFVPDSLKKNFAKIVERKLSVYEILFDLIKKNTLLELHSSIKQTVGVLLNEEIEIIPNGELSFDEQSVLSEIKLIERNEGTIINFGLIGSQSGISKISEKILGTSELSDEDKADSFNNICETIVGRLRSSIESLGIIFNQELPSTKIITKEFYTIKRNLITSFKTESGLKFTSFVELKKQ